MGSAPVTDYDQILMLTMQAREQFEEEEEQIEVDEEFTVLEERFGDQTREEKMQLRADYLDLLRRIEGTSFGSEFGLIFFLSLLSSKNIIHQTNRKSLRNQPQMRCTRQSNT